MALLCRSLLEPVDPGDDHVQVRRELVDRRQRPGQFVGLGVLEPRVLGHHLLHGRAVVRGNFGERLDLLRLYRPPEPFDEPVQKDFFHRPFDEDAEIAASGFQRGVVGPAVAGVNVLADLREFLVPEDRKSTRLNSSHIQKSRMPSSA